MDNIIGSDFEHGLSLFDKMVSGMPDYLSESSDITEVEVKAFKAITVSSNANMDNIAQVMENCFGKLMGIVGNEVDEIGRPFTIYNILDYTSDSIHIECGLPVAKKYRAKGIEFKKISTQRALMLRHIGPYEALPQSYKKINDYIDSNEIEINGSPWEVYVTDPEKEPDQSKWETIIYFPI